MAATGIKKAYRLDSLIPVFKNAMKEGRRVLCFNYNTGKTAYVVQGKKGYRHAGTVYRLWDETRTTGEDVFIKTEYKHLPPRYWFDGDTVDEKTNIIYIDH